MSDPRVDPLAELGHARPRPADRPHVRPDAARGDRALRRTSPAGGGSTRGGDWDLIFRCAVWGVAAGIVGARLYHLATSWSEVPDEWWGAVRDLARRARGLGRDRGRLPRGRHRRQAGRRRRLAARRLPRAGAPARAGARPARQLVEPGALRQADRPAVGARDRSDQPPARLPRPADLPSDVPLRAALGLRGGRAPRLRDRAAVASAAARALRRVHRALLLRALLDGAPPRSTLRTRSLGLRLNAWMSLLGIVVGTTWYVLSQRRDRPAAARAPARAAGAARWPSRAEARPTAAARVAAWRRRFAISSWTSTRSRARSTCCSR